MYILYNINEIKKDDIILDPRNQKEEIKIKEIIKEYDKIEKCWDFYVTAKALKTKPEEYKDRFFITNCNSFIKKKVGN